MTDTRQTKSTCPDRDRLTASRLREVLDYAPDTGVWTWRGNGKQPAGAVAGTAHPRGYHQVLIRGSWYLAHRLAWLFQTGAWPPAQIDHVNLNKADDRWANLRAAKRSQNCANRPQANSTSGFKGVTWSAFHRKWQAQIQTNGKKHHLGYFDTLAMARVVYMLAAWNHFGEFARI